MVCTIMQQYDHAIQSTATVVTDDALLFFLSFEGMLLLMQWYLMQYITSSRSLYSILLLSGYTIIGSALLLTGLSYYYIATGMCMSTCALPSILVVLLMMVPIPGATHVNTSPRHYDISWDAEQLLLYVGMLWYRYREESS